MSDATAMIVDEAEIVVVGAGPTGSSAAATLAELGHEVLLVDKDPFPREKPCGDGLMQPAVAIAERFGLGDVLAVSQPIEAARVVVSHRRQNLTPLVTSSGKPQPRCITRKDFDAALLAGAKARGARFVQARIDAPVESVNGDRPTLVAIADGRSVRIRAHTVVAADGATSRMRRAVSTERTPPSLYAVRQYFESERALDPVFDFYVPLELGDRVLAGYGWVFPIDEHTANVGVGFYRDAFGAHPSLIRVLGTFVEELQTKAARRFGALRPIGEPMGAPLGTRTEVDRLEVGNIVFAGDAAGTTHALSGEGIAFAMRAGQAVAELVHSRSKAPTHPANGAGKMLSRRFPHLGTDVSMLTRLWVREMTEGATESHGSAPRPFLSIVKRLIGESAYETNIEETATWKALNASDSALAQRLSHVNDAILDNVAEEFPFTTEVVHLRVRSHLGPMYAAVALASAGLDESNPPSGAVDAAVAAETIGALPGLLAMLVDRSRSKSAKVNNVFAVLTADFVAARSLMAASKLGAQAVAQLAYAAMQQCEGGMRDAKARFAPDRTRDSWLRAAVQTTGEAVVFATSIGAGISDHGAALPAALREYGIELGVAIRLAEEITDLIDPEAMREGRAGADLRRGIYPLPVLFALEAEPQLARLLAQHLVDSDIPAIVSFVREAGGLDRAISACLEHTNAARAAALALPTAAQGEPLAMLAEVPADYMAAIPSFAK